MIQIKKIVKSIRSLEENSYYHGVVVRMIADYFMVHPMEIHRRIKNHFKIKSTATLTTLEFEELMNDLRDWSVINIATIIPLPNEGCEQVNTPVTKMFANDKDLAIINKKE